jgi:hypothetical protein
MKNKLKRIWMEADVAKFTTSQNLSGEIEKNTKNPNHGSWYPGRN